MRPPIDPDVERDAARWARRVLEGRDLSLDWRAAGYRTAHEAAGVLVGDGGDPRVRERAIELVAFVLRQARGSRGAVLVLTLFLMLGLVMLFAFVVDTGWFYVARNEAQNAADAGALAGAVSLLHVDDEDGATKLLEAEAAARELARLNLVCGQAPDVAVSWPTLPACTPGPVHGRPTCLAVQVTRTCSTLAMGIVGVSTFHAGAYAAGWADLEARHVRLVR